MSADNWTTCPKCFDGAVTEATEKRNAVMASYGSVPVEEFDKARTELTDPQPQEFVTFREDYELWLADDVLHWSYKGACSVCSLGVTEAGEKRFYEPKFPLGGATS
jgi:hypothetical protein